MLINSFLDHLRYERNYSERTITSYRIDLLQFEEFLKGEDENNEFTTVDADLIRGWVVSLMDEKCKPASVNRKLSSLRSFYHFLIRDGKMTVNPMSKVVGPKKTKPLPVFLREDEMSRLLDEIPFEESFEGFRDRLILEMFYSTGIRLSELINIKISDIEKKNRIIKIIGKGNKERYVFFSNECVNYLNAYLEDSRPYLNRKNSEYLFLNNTGDKLTAAGIQYIVKKILDSSGLSVKLTPHVLRHTFATHMLNEGANLMTVKELLGHSNISTTGIYTHVSNEQLRKTYLSSHPRARKDD